MFSPTLSQTPPNQHERDAAIDAKLTSLASLIGRLAARQLFQQDAQQTIQTAGEGRTP